MASDEFIMEIRSRALGLAVGLIPSGDVSSVLRTAEALAEFCFDGSKPVNEDEDAGDQTLDALDGYEAVWATTLLPGDVVWTPAVGHWRRVLASTTCPPNSVTLRRKKS